jgi:hypothetical protein
MTAGIVKRNCDVTTTTSMVFTRSKNANHGPTCVGETGTTSLSGTPFVKVCTGNNYGWFSFNSGNGKERRHFRQSVSYLYPQAISEVHISGFSGNWACSA